MPSPSAIEKITTIRLGKERDIPSRPMKANAITTLTQVSSGSSLSNISSVIVGDQW